MEYSKNDACVLTRYKRYQAAKEHLPLLGSPASSNLTVAVYSIDSVEQLEEAVLFVERVYIHVAFVRISIADLERRATITGSLRLSGVRSGLVRERIKENGTGKWKRVMQN